MCGIVGIVGKSSVNQSIYDALTVLQHRGQDAAGIATWHDGKLLMRKSNGLVRDVFRHQHMLRLQGNVGIGHVRYPTAGCSSSSEAQPFYTNSPFGISLAHNGNLTNAESLKQLIELEDMRHLNTGSDSEILLNVFAHELQESANRDLNADDIFTAVTGVHRRCVGGYAIISMINGYGIVGFRDPHGIRPLVLGKRETNAGVEYMIAPSRPSVPDRISDSALIVGPVITGSPRSGTNFKKPDVIANEPSGGSQPPLGSPEYARRV